MSLGIIVAMVAPYISKEGANSTLSDIEDLPMLVQKGGFCQKCRLGPLVQKYLISYA